MATWHPPIPASKLYSGPALELGPALAMLIWCYDRINRDGSIEVRLETAATDIGKPYGTIKDWWKALRVGGFFCEQIDRGRRGWIVRLKDEWIDWHVMGNNYPAQVGNVSLEAEPSSPDESRDVSPEDAEVPVKAASRQRQGRDVSLESSAYKVLHDDQNSERGGVNSKQAHSPAVSLYFEFYPAETLDANQIGEINRRVTDLKRWRKALTYWTANRHRAQSIGKICDRYDEEGTQNGHRPAGRAPPTAAQPWKPPDDALSGAALQEAIAARMKKRE